MYVPIKINNVNLRNRYSFDSNGIPQRWVEVYIKYSGSWYDVSEDVDTIEIKHRLTIGGLSTMDSAAIRLHNEFGQWDFMKVTDTFNISQKKYNPLMVSLGNKPFLTTNFPVKIVVKYKENNETKSLVLFMGYAFRIRNENKATATLEVYDVFSKLNEKKMHSAYTVPLGPADELVRPFLNELVYDIQADFGVTPELLFNNSTYPEMTSNVLYTIEGGKTYLEAINDALEKSVGVTFFNPEEFGMSGNATRIRTYFMGDGTFELPTASTFTLGIDEIDKFEYEYRNDLPTRIRIEAQNLEVYSAMVDAWQFNSGNDLNNAVLIPAGAQSYVTINFGTKAVAPETVNIPEFNDKPFIKCKDLLIVNYTKEVDATTGKVTYIKGTDRTRKFRSYAFTDSFYLIPLEPDGTYSLVDEISADGKTYGLYVLDTQVGIDSITLLVKNTTNLNYAIVQATIKAYPLIETGANMYIYDTGEKPVIETSMDICYQVQSEELYGRIAKAQFTLIDSKYSAKISLKGFYPDLFPGSAVSITIPDTSIQNLVGYVDTVEHNINAERCVTNITVKFGNVNLSALNSDYYFNPSEYSVTIIVVPENNQVIDGDVYIGDTQFV